MTETALAEQHALEAEYLFSLSIDIAQAYDLGVTPTGHKRFASIAGGFFKGPRLSGAVCPGGSDWIDVRPDGIRQIDVRLLLKTDHGVAIAMRYWGYRLPDSELVNSQHQYRVAVFFQCADSRLDWLNRVVAIGLGMRHPPAGPVYEVFGLR